MQRNKCVILSKAVEGLVWTPPRSEDIFVHFVTGEIDKAMQGAYRLVPK